MDCTRRGATGLKCMITERALYQRINRKLEQDGEQLRTSRSPKWVDTTGRYFTVNVNRNSLECQHVDLEVFGRDLGVMQPWEKLEGCKK